MRKTVNVIAVLAMCLPGVLAVAGDRPPVVSPYDDGRVMSGNSGANTHTPRDGSRSSITIDVFASSAPNAGGSPSWPGYAARALNALENNLSASGNRLTDPTAYERAPAHVPGGEIAVTSFKSWRGVVEPPAPFANEDGNRMHFGLHAYGDGTNKFTLADLTFALHSDDPWDSLVFVGDFIGYDYSANRHGIDWVDGIKGNGNDIVYTSGHGTTLVDEIVYVGVGNAWWPGGDDANPGNPDEGKQGALDDYFAWLAAIGPINVTCMYTILGTTGSDTVTIVPPLAIPDGTLTASGEGGYAHSISSTPINAQRCETHVSGNVTGYSLPNVNAGWFEIGLITKSERDRALVTYGVPSYMFNQAVFLLEMKGDSGNVVMPADYAGDYAGGTGGQQSIGSPFAFDLKLVPSGTAGGTAYLSVNGGAYGAGLTYGRDNWSNYGWTLPPENLSDAYLIAQLYTWDAGQTYSVSFENVIAAAPCATASLTLDPDDECYTTGETVTVQVWMRDIPQTIVGGQFFVQYDPAKLDFVSAAPALTIFTNPVYQSVDEFAGTIDYATGIPFGGTGTSGAAQMAVLTFHALQDICNASNLITWRTHEPPSRLSANQGQVVNPDLVNMDVSDDVPPEITCPAAITIECDESRLPANTGSATATDNCDPAPVITYTDLVNLSGCGGYTGTITRTWKATDHCDNFSTCVQVITVHDTEVPVISGLTVTGGDVNANCEKTVTFSATVDDNCCIDASGVTVNVILTTDNATLGTPTITKAQVDANTVSMTGSVLVSNLMSCVATVRVTVNATDCCAHAATTAQATADVDDNTVPTIVCPPTAYAHPDAGACTQAALVQLFDFETIDPPYYNYYADPGCVAERSTASPFAGDWSGHLMLDADFDWDYARLRVPVTAIPDLDVANVSAMFQAYVVPGSAANLGPFVMLDVDSNQDGTWDGGGGPGEDSIIIAFVTGAAPFKQGCWYTDGLNGATVVHVVGDRTGLTDLEFSSSHSGGLMSALRTHAFSGALTWGDLPILNVRVGAGLWEAGYFECYVDNILVTKHLEVPPAWDDNCGGAAITGVRGDSQPLTAPYPVPSTTITWTATDCCGETAFCNQTVSVDDLTEMVVSVQLSPTMVAGPITRCITFELWKCLPTPTMTPSNHVLSFTSGLASDATVLVPCGNYGCITARDTLHTLRRTATPTIVGGHYVANFTGAPPTGDWLIGGNLNNDNVIDILDFGVFSWQWTMNYGTGDTDCNTPYPNADISGNGSVGTEDFTFIQINFLKANEANCCGQPGFRGEAIEPITRISVAELVARGLGELAAGDINGDGWLDEEDMALFASNLPPMVLRGDTNCDGVVNLADINPFVQAVSSPAAWQQEYPNCNPLNGDINGDGFVDFRDINPFVALLTSGG